jgi:quercetin dioxygenase-like cupin family protein
MEVLRTPWPGPGPADETAIRAAYRAEGLSPYAWSNGPGDRYSVHSHATHKVLYCVRGSITFTLGDTGVELLPGDRLDLPAGTPHGAVVGDAGVLCLEAHHSA